MMVKPSGPGLSSRERWERGQLGMEATKRRRPVTGEVSMEGSGWRPRSWFRERGETCTREDPAQASDDGTGWRPRPWFLQGFQERAERSWASRLQELGLWEALRIGIWCWVLLQHEASGEETESSPHVRRWGHPQGSSTLGENEGIIIGPSTLSSGFSCGISFELLKPMAAVWT